MSLVRVTDSETNRVNHNCDILRSDILIRGIPSKLCNSWPNLDGICPSQKPK